MQTRLEVKTLELQAPRVEEESPEARVAAAFDSLARAVGELRLRAEERSEIERLLAALYQSLGGVVE